MVTRGDVAYEGSIEIPQDLVEAAGIWPGEKVLVASITSGNRFETYVLVGPPGTGQIIINGGAAHLIKAGERVVIMSFALDDKPITPKRIVCNELNEIIFRANSFVDSYIFLFSSASFALLRRINK